MNSPSSPRRAADRRRVLGSLGSLGLLTLAGCGGGSSSGSSDTSTFASSLVTSTATSTAADTATTATSTSGCQVVPEETAGPYPADGSSASNATYNVLALAGIVRSDVRSNIGGSAQVGGAPLTITITLTDTRSACAPLAGYAIYLWHCTREGTYSVYTTQSLADNHLRGVQQTDAGGSVRFVTVVPGCYAGRMPHMHLEIYRDLSTATSAGNKLRTTQLAFPTDALRSIYASTAGYSQSVANLNAISFASDNVFSDGTALEMVGFAGDAADGYTASITISIAA
jgi:protocatechuate 3,4-dioxygenase beta subunit